MIIDVNTKFKIGQTVYFVQTFPEPKIESFAVDRISIEVAKDKTQVYYYNGIIAIAEESCFSAYTIAKDAHAAMRGMVI